MAGLMFRARGLRGRHVPVKRFADDLIVLLAYAAMVMWVFWPLAARAFTHYQAGGDAGSFIWGFWWVRDSLEHLRYPFTSTDIFWPVGTPLGFHTLMPILGVVSIPLQWMVGPALAFNLLVLSALVLAGHAMYLLARDLGMPPSAAFVSGLAYGFFPPLVDRLAIEHLNLAFTLWLPLSVLALRACLRHDEGTAHRSSIWLGLVVAAALYTDLTLTVFAVIVLGAYAGGWLVVRRRRLQAAVVFAWRRLRAGVLTAGLLAAPYLAVLLRTQLVGEEVGVAGLGGARQYSADVASFALVNSRHRWFGETAAYMSERLEGLPQDGTAYLGFTIMALATIGLATHGRRPLVRWAALLVLAGMALSLGPVLHVWGRAVVPLATQAPDGDGVVSLLMPFTWLQAVPGLDGFRSPVRFLTLAGLGLGVLAGYGFMRISAGASRFGRAILILMISGLVCLEVLVGRMPLTSADVPDVYDVIAEAEGAGAVVDVPLGFRSGLGNQGQQAGPPMVWATHHRRPIAVGFGARTATWRLDALAAMPLYRDILMLQEGQDPAGQPDPIGGLASALALEARWVVIDGGYPRVEAYLAEVGYQHVKSGGGRRLYELPELRPSNTTRD